MDKRFTNMAKRIFAAMLAATIITGTILYTTVGDVFGDTVINASATNYKWDGTPRNFSICTEGDTFEYGVWFENDTGSTLYLVYDDNSQAKETIAPGGDHHFYVKSRLIKKEGNTWTFKDIRSSQLITDPVVNSMILYDGSPKTIIESGAELASSKTVYYGISDSYSVQPSDWYTNINDSNLKRKDKGEYFLWMKADGDENNYKPLLTWLVFTITDDKDMLQSYFWGGNSDGSQSNPFIISDVKGWNFLCDALENSSFNGFSGKYFRLDSNITVTRMAGSTASNGTAFKGNFNGKNMTLTFNHTADSSYTAPFRCVDGTVGSHAVINNLNVKSNITSTGYRHISGLIALQSGYVDINNCNAEVDISGTATDTEKNLYPAGLVSQASKSNSGTLKVTGCTVTGKILTNGKYAAGMIGVVQGTTNIEDCLSSVEINSSTSGDGTHGGFVGVTETGSSLNIEGCLFNGKLLGKNTEKCGGFIGWRQSTANIYDSIFDPADVTVKENSSATFARNDVDTYNCYYTYLLNDKTNYVPGSANDTDHPDKWHNGKAPLNVKAGQWVTISHTPVVKTYNVSGITSHSSGVDYNGKFYIGQGDTLILSHEDRSIDEYRFKNYTATSGTVNGNTLTVGDVDATVNAVYEWNYVWAYWYNDDGTFLVGNVCKRGGVPHYPSEDNYKLTKWSSSYEYNYVFDGWDPAITSISANTNYTAKYKKEYIEYQFLWYNHDGTVLDKQKGKCDNPPTYSGVTPTRPKDAQYTYTFKGWSGREWTTYEGNRAVKYKAQYSTTTNEYTVTWKNSDGTTLETDKNVPYGTMPEYNGTIPSGYEDERYTYTYGWDKEVTTVKGDITYTLKLIKTPLASHFSINGDTYTIKDDIGWEIFCECLQDKDTYNCFSGKTVELAKDISITRMAGTSNHDFCGTFDGKGNTLNVNISSDEITAEPYYYVAPFRYISNINSTATTIQNLIVKGKVKTSYQYAGGLVGGCWGTLNIKNCKVDTVIESSISGDGTHGGIVGIQQKGTLNIEGCVFDGKLLGANTTKCGGFVGWKKETVNIINSLYAPADTSTGETYVKTEGSASFVRNNGNLTNCYFTKDFNDGTNYTGQGKQARTITAGENVTLSLTGKTTQENPDGYTEYSVSGITAYENNSGLKYGNIFYAGNGDTVSLTLEHNTPTGYTFKGYTVNAGTITDDSLTMPDKNVVINAVNEINKYTVTWIDGDGKTLKTESLEYGTIPSYTGTPTKTATAQYTYTFTGWDKEITEVKENVTYTAQFSSTVNKYTVTWIDGDGKTLKTESLEYGTVPSYTGTPTKAATAQYTYTFTGWDKEITEVKENVTYTAQFSSTVNKYTVTWIDGDGNTLKTESLEYGTVPSYTGTPTKTATAQYTYTFTGWDKEITEVKENVTYTAQFSSTVNKYTVTWIDGDGKTLKTESLEYGTVPEYTGTPTKTATAQYTYTFTGWDKEITKVKKNVTYTAQFSSTVNKYTVTWIDGDGNTLKTESLEYGTVPAFTTTPTKAESEFYTYTFRGWGKEITAITGDVTYTAVFRTTPRHPLAFTVCDSTRVNSYVPYYSSVNSFSTATEQIYPSSMLTSMNGKKLCSMTFYSSDDYVIDVKGMQVYLAEVDFTTLSDKFAKPENGIIKLYNVENKRLTDNCVETSFNAVKVYDGNYDFGIGENVIEFDTPYEYNGGNLLVIIQNTSPGTKDDIKRFYAEYNKEIGVGAFVYGSNNYSRQFDCLAKCKFDYVDENKYTLTWKDANENIIKTDTDVLSGTMPEFSGTIPPAPQNYHFKGWTPDVSVVTGDAVYTVVYEHDPYTVTFDEDNGNKTTKRTDANSTVSSYIPTKNSYIFAGWYLGDTLYDFSTPVNADITLKAHWTDPSNVKTLQVGTVFYEGDVVDFGDFFINTDITTLIPPKASSITKDHVVYDKSQLFPTDFTSGLGLMIINKPEYDNNGKRYLISDANDKDKCFYRSSPYYGTDVGIKVVGGNGTEEKPFIFEMFVEGVHIISLVAEGDTTSSYTMTVADGEICEYDYSDIALSIKGDDWIFLGWYTADGVKFDFSKPVTTDVTLYEKWALPENMHTVSFVAEGDTTPSYTMTVADGEICEYDYSDIALSVKGDDWIFLGWYTADGVKFDFSKLVTADVTLYEKWVSISEYDGFIVTFMVYNNVIKKITINEGGLIDYNLGNREGFIFDGWSDETGNLYDPDMPVTKNMTLTARYTKDPEFTGHYLTFKDGDEIVDIIGMDEGEYIYGPKYFNETKDGHFFDNWYLGDTLYDFNTPLDADITLTAHWIDISIAKPLKVGMVYCNGDLIYFGNNYIRFWDNAKNDYGVSFISNITYNYWYNRYCIDTSGRALWLNESENYGSDVSIRIARGTGTVTNPFEFEVVIPDTKHTVVWEGTDGKVLETDKNVQYGTHPLFDGSITPPEGSVLCWTDGTKTYLSSNLPVVTGDVTYKAVFKKIKTVEVGTVLFEGDVADFGENYLCYHKILDFIQDGYGLMVIDKPIYSNYENGYHFQDTIYFSNKYIHVNASYSGTDVGLIVTDGDGTEDNPFYFSIYKDTKYTVTWIGADGTVLETDTGVQFGIVPMFDGDLTIPDGSVLCWSDGKNTYLPDELPIVTDDITYKAVFKELKTVAVGTILFEGDAADFGYKYFIFDDSYDANYAENSLDLVIMGKFVYNQYYDQYGINDSHYERFYVSSQYLGNNVGVMVTGGDGTYENPFTFKIIKEFTVKFKEDTETVKNVNIISGDRVTSYSVSEREGYTFVGWVDANGDLFDFDTPITRNITLTALWIEKPISIKFIDVNGNTKKSLDIYSMNGLSDNVSDQIVIPSAPYIEGYAFKGWSVGEEFFDNADELKKYLALLAADVPEDITVNEVYEQNNSFRVTVNAGIINDGGTTDTFSPLDKVYIKATDGPNGQKFSHWMKDGIIVSYEKNYVFCMPEKDVTFSAVYVTDYDE